MRRSILVVLAPVVARASARAALDPVGEAKNYSKTLERQALYDSPAGRLLLTQVSRQNGHAAPPATAGTQAMTTQARVVAPGRSRRTPATRRLPRLCLLGDVARIGRGGMLL